MRHFKHFLIALAFIASMALPASAQFKIGPRIGLEVNKMHFSGDLFNSDNRAGFTGGLEAELMIPGVGLGLDASVMYVRRNGEVFTSEPSGNGNYTNSTVKTNRDYIAVPINIKWKIGIPLIARVVRPFLFTGPEFAFLTSRKAISDAWRNKKTDVSWNFGFGAEFFSHLQLSASYGVGMTKAASWVGATSSSSSDIDGKNRYWTVTAAYLF